jgi:ATP-binding cassette subfamily B protein
MKKVFPFYKQLDQMDCGPACLRMICKFYEREISVIKIRNLCEIGKNGVNLLGIAKAAETIGFRATAVKLSYKQLIEEAPLPAILHWGQNHFVVAIKNSNKGSFFPLFMKHFFTSEAIQIADPAKGVIKIRKNEFLEYWAASSMDQQSTGIALLLEPTISFYNNGNSIPYKNSNNSRFFGSEWKIVLPYFLEQKKFLFQLILGLVVASLFQLIFPFLTQSIVDVGIQTNNISFIYIVLIAQLMLSFGRISIDFIRSRLFLYISTRINISLLSDFWIKLMKLPLSFFDSKKTGDIIQRIGDHKKIEAFLTGSALNTFFSIFNIFIFSVVLLQYNVNIFLIFCIGSILYFLWIKIFLSFRRVLNYKYFSLASKENTTTMQLINGMQEIRLSNTEQFRRWEWEEIQANLFKLHFKSLSISQLQQAGAFFINEGKNIFITFLAAKSVIDGQLTLGAMLAIQYIIGQLNGPIDQIVSLIQEAQDAKISLERLNEIHDLKNEASSGFQDQDTIEVLPNRKGIVFKKVSFTYTGAGNAPILKEIDLHIPEGKVTAIVGMSGSGKTTLLKLLLRFYEDYKGDIDFEENSSWKRLDHAYWRSKCGSVMQEGFIFSDSIVNNIATNDNSIDYDQLIHACKIANIIPFIDSLPLGFDTKIGAEGNGISQGQKQRILIARAVYKNPDYLFLDEATNALDANNESEIMQNLYGFFKGKTVVIVAHRLSTVKNANKIVVLQNGEIVEEGTHEILTSKRGYYYKLIENQLEL